MLNSLPSGAAEGQQQQQQQKLCKTVWCTQFLSTCEGLCPTYTYMHTPSSVISLSCVPWPFPTSRLAAVVTLVAYVSRWSSLNADQLRVKCSLWHCAFLRHTHLCFSFRVCSCVHKFLALCHCRGFASNKLYAEKPSFRSVSRKKKKKGEKQHMRALMTLRRISWCSVASSHRLCFPFGNLSPAYCEHAPTTKMINI